MPAGSIALSQSLIDDRHSDGVIVTWDEGRLLVNRRFARLLEANGLTNAKAILDWQGGETVRRIGERETTRIVLDGPDGPQSFYLKRHGPPRWKDRIVPLLRFSLPILGAKNEWDAIQSFVAAGIPTMTPVAYGSLGERSFLITQALSAQCNLLEWAERNGTERASQAASEGLTVRELVPRVAEIARRMHDAGLHHQDFYLNHMLLCEENDIRVIDLGRVRQHRRLGRRWIIKDLAQLDFSARSLTCRERVRFLRLYLGRRLNRQDRAMIRQIVFKSRRIAVHTAKHGL